MVARLGKLLCRGATLALIVALTATPSRAEERKPEQPIAGLSTETPPSPEGEERRLIGQVVRARLPELIRCYENRLTEAPGLQGRVMARFDIGPTGRVVGVSADGVDDAELIRCMRAQISGWQFQKPASGGKLRVAYPFVFQPRA